MNKGRKKLILLSLGFIGIGMLISFLVLIPKEELTNKTNLISSICLFLISIFTIMESMSIKVDKN
jgi:hypothetical protein